MARRRLHLPPPGTDDDEVEDRPDLLFAAARAALEATPHGVTVVDLRLPDQPLVYVNPAFAALAGLPADEVVGRNCRFLQGPDTDPAAVAALRAAVERGEECRVTLLNHRGPDRVPWWNEVRLLPVTDGEGRVVQYVGMQQDVTARVEAERALERERDRTRGYLARLEEMAATDPLTGLLQRGRFEEQVTAALWEARAADDALALVAVDVDGFAPLSDRLGHAVGDALLQVVAARLRGRLRRTDLVARVEGHRFLVALADLSTSAAEAEAHRLAAALTEAVAQPVTVHGHGITVGVRTGVAVFPRDGADVEALLRAALDRTSEPAPDR